MSTPGLVYAAQFVQAKDAMAAGLLYSDQAIGYLGREDAFLSRKEKLQEAMDESEKQRYSSHAFGYLGREKATDLFNASTVTEGHRIYFGKPGEGVEENSYGVFTAEKDSLSDEEKQTIGQLFDASERKDCPLYTTVISFDNPFLEKYGIDFRSPEGQHILKEYTRVGVANLIRHSQLGENNTVWTAAIHYNTDNLHIHIDLVEKDKIQREKDMLPVAAFDKLKSAVMNKIVDNRYTVELDNVIRKNLLQGVKEQQYDPEILTGLLRKLPRNVPWEYNRQGMKPYQQLIRQSVDAVIKSSPELTVSRKRLDNDLKEYETFLRDLYGAGKRDLAKRAVANKLNDFYIRAGNALLQEADGLRPDFEEKERLRREAEKPVADSFPDLPDYAEPEGIEIVPDGRTIREKNRLTHSEPDIRLPDYSGEIGGYSNGKRTSREKNEDAYEGLEEPEPAGQSDTENRGRYDELTRQAQCGDTDACYRLGCLIRAGVVDAPEPDAAILLFSFAAEHGHTAAAYQLGRIHADDRLKHDPELARYWFERAANAGHDGAMYRLGKLYEKTNPGMAEMWYKKAAEQQNVFAALRLAELYKTGKIEDDAQLGDEYQRWAFLLLQKQENRPGNNDYVHYQLGRMAEKGQGTDRDLPEAVYQYMIARSYSPALQEAIRMSNDPAILRELAATAENGDERAKLSLVLLDECRKMECPPYAKYTDEFRKALDQLREGEYETANPGLITEALTGNVYAAAELGRVYQRGLGVDVDEEKAAAYYKQAYDGLLIVNAEKPDAYLQYRIGKMVQRGLGTEADDAKALEWFLMAASEGNKFAEFSAGNCFYSGTGCEQDYEKARHYFGAAAKEGNAFALYKLGVMAERGQGMNVDAEKAFEYYASAFSLFHAQADKTMDEQLQYRLGMMALHGKGTEVNPTLAAEYFSKSADQGNMDAKLALSRLYLKGNGIEKNMDLAVQLLTECAEKDPQAQYTLGHLYLAGEDVEKDVAKAVQLLQASADQGNEFAQYTLGRAYLAGADVEKDINKGVQLLTASADQGNEFAQYKLGCLLYEGEEVEQNIAKSVKYLQAAADQKNAYALYRLGSMAEAGHGMAASKDAAFAYYAQAFSIFQEEADKTGDEQLQYRLGWMALNGKGIEPNPSLAVEYFEKSAGQGNEDAASLLANLYLSGRKGVAQDVGRAVELLTILAEKDDQAQYTLGRLYLDGEEVKKDADKAIRYLGMSADQGNQYAEYALGRLYLDGKDISIDTIKGTRYLQASADQKNSFAQYALGLYYLRSGQAEMGSRLLTASAAQGNTAADQALAHIHEQQRNRPRQKLDAAVSSQRFARKAQHSLRRLARDYGGHIRQLETEFDYEQERQNYRQASL